MGKSFIVVSHPGERRRWLAIGAAPPPFPGPSTNGQSRTRSHERGTTHAIRSIRNLYGSNVLESELVFTHTIRLSEFVVFASPSRHFHCLLKPQILQGAAMIRLGIPILLLVSSTASRFNLESLPDCAASCIYESFTAVRCSDQKCVCDPEKLREATKTIGPCLFASCEPSEIEKALKAHGNMCGPVKHEEEEDSYKTTIKYDPTPPNPNVPKPTSKKTTSKSTTVKLTSTSRSARSSPTTTSHRHLSTKTVDVGPTKATSTPSSRASTSTTSYKDSGTPILRDPSHTTTSTPEFLSSTILTEPSSSENSTLFREDDEEEEEEQRQQQQRLSKAMTGLGFGLAASGAVIGVLVILWYRYSRIARRKRLAEDQGGLVSTSGA
ncbi:hypothetical protein MKZ38_008326 [Zalerion maritima]|uniref:CFEM domain-containing protein n=1 Tax=Zalerion maritima TaxID=339359 RepID=A0AAD5RHN8_9PEZI|nr:hypothetical protein MKZ38_008326 [Zalerion maritima]